MRALFELKAGVLPASGSRWTHLSCQRPASLVDVDQSQHGKGAVGLPDQAPIARLGNALQRCERPEHVLGLGENRRLTLVGQRLRVAQRPVAVGAATTQPGFLSMDQVGQLRAVCMLAAVMLAL